MSSDQMYRPAEYQSAPFNPLPLAGWALIAGSIIYTVYVIAPPRFLDPRWEFDTMGLLANNSLLPLLGISLVLYGRQPAISLQNLIAYRGLLIACFSLVALSLLMIPLAVGDQRRLTSAANTEMAGLMAAQTDREMKIEKLIDGAKTIQDLTAMGSMVNMPPTPEERRVQHLDENFDAFKNWTQRRMQGALAEQRMRTVEQYQERLTGLEKDLVRIVAVNLLTAFCYLLLGVRNLGVFGRHVTAKASRG